MVMPAPPTVIQVSTLDELNGAIAYVDGQTSGSYEIKLTADIYEGTSQIVQSGGGNLVYPGGLKNADGTTTAMSNGQPVAARNDLYALSPAPGVTLTIEGANGAGGAYALDGRNSTVAANGTITTGTTATYRGLFVYAGNVTIDDLTIQNAVAKGGNGGHSAGGGAGLGGGLFIGSNVAGNAGAVTLDNVTFLNDGAVGGNGGADVDQGYSAGGGGGLGGNGSSPFRGSGGGGGGIGASGGIVPGASGGGAGGNGGTGGAGSPGTGVGATAGSSGSAAGAGSAGSPSGGGGGNGGRAGGGGNGGFPGQGGSPGFFGYSGGFGGGGGGGVGGAPGRPGVTGHVGTNRPFDTGGTGGSGGNGGFGGGGGGGGNGDDPGGTPVAAGNGGFGGGGGADFEGAGGNGGFGGGGGSGEGNRAQGGFGGGNPGVTGGGGGLGAGGDIFVQGGASLEIVGGALSGGSVTKGGGSSGGYYGFSTGPGSDGAADGTGIFLQGDQAVTLAAAPNATQTISDVITDQDANGAGGAGRVTIGDATHTGTVLFAATNTYTGGTTITSGTLEIGAMGAAGSGAITFASASAALKLDATPTNGTTFTNHLAGIAIGDTIDLAALGYQAGATATVSGSTLKVTSGSTSESFTLDSPGTTVFTVSKDSGTGTQVTAVKAPILTSATYDATAGTLALTGQNFVSGFDATQLTLTGQGGSSYQLTSGTTAGTPGTDGSGNATVTFTLDTADKTGLAAILDLNGTTALDGTHAYGLAAGPAWDTNATATTVPVTTTHVPPVITSESFASPGGTNLEGGKSVTFSVTFSEPVTVTNGGHGTPSLVLTGGRTAAYAGGSGSNTLTFTYKVQAGDNQADLKATGFGALPTGTTIQDTGGNSAILPGFTSIDTGVKLDTTPPTLTSFTTTSSSPTNASDVFYTLTLSEPVTQPLSSDFALAGTASGAHVASITPVAGSSGTSYVVDVATGTTDGTLVLSFVGTSVRDQAGNAYGGGAIQPQTTVQTGTDPFAGPSTVAVSDLNGDGKADLVVANSGDGTVSVLLGKGDGTFQPQTVYSAGNAVYSVAIGDINGDGVPDIVVGNDQSNGTLTILTGNGNGTFQPGQTLSAGIDPESVKIADVNGDGIADLVFVNDPTSGNGTVSVMLGQGNGTFQARTAYAVGAGPSSVAIADVNGDGIPDLVVTNDNTKSGTVSVLLGNGNGTFQAQKTYTVGAFPRAVAIGDFNGDGIPDLAVTNTGSNTVSVLLGKGDGTFQTQKTYSTGSNSGPYAIAVADINGDGKADLVVADTNNNKVSILLGNGDGTFQAQTSYGVGASPNDIAIADLNGDGRPDILVPNQGGGSASNTVSLLLDSPVAKAAATLTLDKTPPSLTAGESVSGLTNRTTDTISATASDLNGVANVHVFDGTTDLGAATLSNGAYSLTVSGLTDGPHTFTAKATDGAGNVATTSVGSVTVDTTAPTLSAGESVSGLTKQTTDTISATASDLNGIASVHVFDGTTDLGAATLSNGAYSLTVSGLTDGPHTFTAKATDNAGNVATTSAGSVTVDTTAPTLTATESVSGLTKQTTDTITATASDLNGIASVHVFDGTTDLGAATLSNGAYSLTVSGLTDGPHTFTAKATDDAGNVATTSAGSVTIDTTAPTLTGVTLDKGVYKAGDTVTATIELGGSYDGNGTYTLGAGSTLDGMALTAGTYDNKANTLTASFVVGPGTTEVLAGYVAENIVVNDAAGNASAADTTPVPNTTIDAQAPTAVSVAGFANGATDTGKSPVAASATIGALSTTDATLGDSFSYALGGTDANAFQILNGVLDVGSTALADGTVYDLTITSTDQGGNSYAQALQVTGASVPSVTAIDRVAGAATLTNATSDAFTVSFSQAVSGVTASNFTLSGNGVGGTIGTPATTDKGLTWTVPVTGVTGTGTLGLDLTSTTGIVSASTGTALGGTHASDQDFTVDQTPPTFTGLSETPASGTVGIGQTVTLALTPSETVSVSGTPTLTLNNGGTAVYDAKASTPTALVFDYVVRAGDGSVAALTPTTFNLPTGATVEDIAGNAANLSLTRLNQAGGISNQAGGGPQIDAVAPTLIAVSESPATGLLQAGDTDVLTLSTDKAVTVSGVPKLALNNGGTATYNAEQSTPTSLAFDYIVSQSDQNVAALAATSIVLANGATMIDAAGNAANLSIAGLSQNGPQVAPDLSLFGSITHDVRSASGDVYALYETILGRAPDPYGFEVFVAEREAGTSLKAIAKDLLTSPEHHATYGRQSNSAFINQIFENTVHSPPASSELHAWDAALASGTPRANAAVALARSQESRANLAAVFQTGVFVQSATASTIARLYYGLLDRAPDAGGLASFEAATQQGASLKAVARAIIQSSEYAGLHGAPSNAQFVESLFEGAFGRTEGAGGAQGYLHQLNAGVSRAAVALQIAKSPEAVTHLYAQVEGGFHVA